MPLCDPRRTPGLPFEPAAPPSHAADRAPGANATTLAEEWAALPGIDATTGPQGVPLLTGEFWTSRQRAANSLHEVSYRACFKPQLPAFFITRLTAPDDRVYDPFMGRGTTLLEAALLGRQPAGCDINPLSRVLVAPRLRPPSLHDVAARLAAVGLDGGGEAPPDLDAFYHPDTLREICGLRDYLAARRRDARFDAVDAWIEMVAVNRLTGHSPGFFSVYTMPPNQAVSAAVQRRLNETRAQVPPRRDVRAIVLRKSRQLLGDSTPADRARLDEAARDAWLLTAPASATPALATASVDLVVTSPPFLDVVNYAGDNWLRCWFAGIDPATVAITQLRGVEAWSAAMGRVFTELHRVVRPGGHVAFEVGEVRRGTVRLEDHVVPAAAAAGFTPVLVLVNAQQFTKTANCWGVSNNAKGTNTNRVVLLRR